MTSMFGAWLGKQRLEIRLGPAERQPLPTFLAGRPHQKWGFFGISFPLSVSTSLMVGVGSGSKHFHALGVLACGPLKPPSGTRREPWVGVGKEVEELPPQSIPRGCRGPVLGIPGQGGSSSHFWFWSCFAGFKLSFTLWNCPELLEGSCPGTNPSFSGCHPCSLRLPDLCSERDGSESGQLLAMTGGTGPPHTSARGLGALCQASPVRS